MPFREDAINDDVLLDFAATIVSRIERWVVNDPPFQDAFRHLERKIENGGRINRMREDKSVAEDMSGTLAFVDFKSNFKFLRLLNETTAHMFFAYIERIARDTMANDRFRSMEIVRSRLAFMLSLNMFSEMLSPSRIERLKRYLSS